MKFLIVSFIFFSSAAFAESNITSLINSKGDLVVVIVDKPNEGPYDGATLWSSMVGSDATKQIKVPTFSLTCATTVTEPLKERFGSCRIVLSKERVNYGNGYYGGIVSDEKVLESLIDSNHSFVDGKLLITVDHSQKALGIKIDESLVSSQ
ncbi:hypothetical protein [Pseudobdellovibrio sp. HCB154]|uniref:hypothetical protein n=1 Tax=Pseudobdellovibrio sp. HCB154 TaxID=3386277 RepID=UPI0039174D9B